MYDMAATTAQAHQHGAVDIGKTIHPHPTLGEHRHGGGSGAWQLHGCAACAQVSPQPSYPTRPELATVRALCFAYPNNRRRILCICTVFMPITAKPKLYKPTPPRTHAAVPNGSRALRDLARLPARVSSTARATTHPKPFVRKAFAKYLECGIFAHGFCPRSLRRLWARLLCSLLLQRPGSLPSCTTRRMVETAAHLNDHVFPPPAGAPVGALRAQEVAVLHATRRERC